MKKISDSDWFAIGVAIEFMVIVTYGQIRREWSERQKSQKSLDSSIVDYSKRSYKDVKDSSVLIVLDAPEGEIILYRYDQKHKRQELVTTLPEVFHYVCYQLKERKIQFESSEIGYIVEGEEFRAFHIIYNDAIFYLPLIDDFSDHSKIPTVAQSPPLTKIL